jgi:hypothetical protein
LFVETGNETGLAADGARRNPARRTPQCFGVLVSNSPTWSFLFVPVLAGAVLLAAFAYVWHRWTGHRPWPPRRL